MPFLSDKQRKYLYAKHPDIAERWAKETPKGKKLPTYVKHITRKDTGAKHES